MKTYLALLGILVLLVGCTGAASTPSPSPSPTPADVNGRVFLSTAVTKGGAAFDLVPNTRIRLSFGADGNLGASAGCNSIGGQYAVVDGVLRFQGGGMTEMGCDPARHDQDDWLSTILSANPTVAFAGSDLVLTAGDTVITLGDREVVEPDLPLTGTKWTVTTIFSGDTASSIPGGAVATLEFFADGKVTLNTGCNQGGGTAIVEGGMITFRDIVTTDMACGGAAGQLEQAVAAVLNGGSVEWAIDASGLTLMAGAAGLGLTGG
jgi:heat shock protein HslJ